MNIFRLLFEIFLLYLAYKFIFEFIIPLYKTSKQVRQKMAEMQEKMEHHRKGTTGTNPSASTDTKMKTTVGGDYIEYEEIK